MSAIVGVGLTGPKADSWDLTKGKMETVDTWFLMASPSPTAIILASYLLFVLRVGPSYMEKRSPFQLKNTLLLYNAVQVIFSVFLAAKCFKHHWHNGVVHSECVMNNQETQSEVADILWWYLIAKVTELLDTVFFVLRKKDAQMSFLHIYHHSIMVAGTWVILKYGPSDHVIFAGLLNSCVHIIMYSYYGLAAMGPGIQKYLWWKKYLTRIQLIQFVIIAIKLSLDAKVSECPLPRGVYWYFVSSLFLFFYLFADFYRKEFLTKYKTTEKPMLSKPFIYDGVKSEEAEEKSETKNRIRRSCQ